MTVERDLDIDLGNTLDDGSQGTFARGSTTVSARLSNRMVDLLDWVCAQSRQGKLLPREYKYRSDLIRYFVGVCLATLERKSDDKPVRVKSTFRQLRQLAQHVEHEQNLRESLDTINGIADLIGDLIRMGDAHKAASVLVEHLNLISGEPDPYWRNKYKQSLLSHHQIAATLPLLANVSPQLVEKLQ